MRLASPLTADGTTLDSAVQYLHERRRELRVVPLNEVHVDPDSGALVQDGMEYLMTRKAAHQLFTKVGVTPGYALKVPNALAANNANTFLREAKGHVQLCLESVGGSDPIVAGVLKERTRPVDPLDVLDRVGEGLIERHDFQLRTWRVDAQGFSIRTSDRERPISPVVGDLMEAMVDITVRQNDELTITVQGGLYRLICLNGATSRELGAVRRGVIKEAWRDPSARIRMTLAAIPEIMDEITLAVPNLKVLAERSLDLPDVEDRITFVRVALEAIPVRPIKGRAFAETVSEQLYLEGEGRTGFDLFNALTSIGRESMVPDRRVLFESAGWNLARDPEPVFRALDDIR